MNRVAQAHTHTGARAHVCVVYHLGMGWVFPFTVRQALLSWQETRVGKKWKKVWRVAPLCLFWTAWREMNRMTFDNEIFSAHRMKSSFICNLWSWSIVYSGYRDGSLLDFLTWMGYR